MKSRNRSSFLASRILSHLTNSLIVEPWHRIESMCFGRWFSYLNDVCEQYNSISGTKNRVLHFWVWINHESEREWNCSTETSIRLEANHCHGFFNLCSPWWTALEMKCIWLLRYIDWQNKWGRKWQRIWRGRKESQTTLRSTDASRSRTIHARWQASLREWWRWEIRRGYWKREKFVSHFHLVLITWLLLCSTWHLWTTCRIHWSRHNEFERDHKRSKRWFRRNGTFHCRGRRGKPFQTKSLARQLEITLKWKSTYSCIPRTSVVNFVTNDVITPQMRPMMRPPIETNRKDTKPRNPCNMLAQFHSFSKKNSRGTNWSLAKSGIRWPNCSKR